MIKSDNKRQEGYAVVIPERVKQQIENAPTEVQEEIERLVQSFVDGSKNSVKVGKLMNVRECDEKLQCLRCKSVDIEWVEEIDDDEIYYNCNNCGESAWMTKKEFEEAKERHWELLFR